MDNETIEQRLACFPRWKLSHNAAYDEGYRLRLWPVAKKMHSHRSKAAKLKLSEDSFMVQGSDIEEVIAKALRHVAANEAAAARRAQMLG